MATLPSWLKAADPASYEAEGLRIGDEESNARASQAAQQAAGARADQELQLRQKQLEMQATQAAQKYQAQQGYQQFLAGGGDPVQAILKFGPAMGGGTDVAAAIRAQQLNAPKPAPSIQMIQGPNGPVPVMTGPGRIVNPNLLTPKAAPVQEQFSDSVRQINGRDIPGQVSSKTGKFIPYPAGEQSGAITPQQRLQLGVAQKQKAGIEKLLGDESQLLALAKKRASGKSPTHADLEAVEGDLQKKVDQLDDQIAQLSGGQSVENVPRGNMSQSVTATNPKTGEKIQYVNGQWQPATP